MAQQQEKKQKVQASGTPPCIPCDTSLQQQELPQAPPPPQPKDDDKVAIGQILDTDISTIDRRHRFVGDVETLRNKSCMNNREIHLLYSEAIDVANCILVACSHASSMRNANITKIRCKLPNRPEFVKMVRAYLQRRYIKVTPDPDTPADAPDISVVVGWFEAV
jgi:hypothetical protein